MILVLENTIFLILRIASIVLIGHIEFRNSVGRIDFLIFLRNIYDIYFAFSSIFKSINIILSVKYLLNICEIQFNWTGLESRLVGKEEPMLARGSEKFLSTGFQIAYGFIAVIDELNSYNQDAMTLFDYRYFIRTILDHPLLDLR